ncbi:NAD-dependent epimerase/dehydratase family protein [Halopseudomonas salegens]|nr:NAD-dependent epimerase/dehydratase family protein [Halopseudomonas salegens]
MTQILVTGGAGFIGSHLCERLAHVPGNHVVSLDNYFTGRVENHVDNVTYLTGDSADVESLVDFAPDCIYHLGEYSRVEQSFDDIDKVWTMNKQGTFALLQFCRKTGAKLVYAGSSTKFGDGGLGRNQSPYAWSKASNTELVRNYGAWFNVPYAIVYFYNVFGRREIASGRYATLIGAFAERMRRGESLSVVSPGTQKRNFTHVDDIVDGLIRVGEQGFGDDFGIGNPEALSVLDVAALFGGDVIMLPERQGNRMTADLMTDKTRALGWSVQTSLSDYIAGLRQNNWVTD